jgi:hypothetical protein
MDWLISHGILEIITAIFLFLMGIIVNGLRADLKENKQVMKELAKSLEQLNITMSKDYMSRVEAEKNNHEVWERLDRHDARITGVSERVTRLEAREGTHG